MNSHRKYSCRYHFLSNDETQWKWTYFLQAIQGYMKNVRVPAHLKQYFKMTHFLPSMKKPIAHAQDADVGSDLLSRACEQVVTSLEFAETVEGDGIGESLPEADAGTGESLPIGRRASCARGAGYFLRHRQPFPWQTH